MKRIIKTDGEIPSIQIPETTNKMTLNVEQIKAFRVKVSNCFKELRRCGVKCRKNFSCCGSCGHSEMSDGYDGSYVFYHAQSADNLRAGDDSVYLAHSIAGDKVVKVREIVRRYGSDWDGHEDSTIMIPFINLTEEQILENMRVNADRVAGLARVREVEVAMGLENGWKDMTDLLIHLTAYCVAENFYRKENVYHELTSDEMWAIRRSHHPTAESMKEPRITGGCMFLDEEGGKDGMIRLYYGEGNSMKWSFFEEDGQMKTEMA